MLLTAFLLAALPFSGYPPTDARPGLARPGCERESPAECVALSLQAMGGHDRLAGLRALRTHSVGHTLLTEQSYRQAPFISSYDREVVTVDFALGRVLTESHVVWPEADPHTEDSDATTVVGPEGGVRRSAGADTPCSLSEIDAARHALALGPARLLLTAAAAPDLHFEAGETLRSTEHTVLAFTWRGVPVRVALNRFNHLPDAVETVQAFHDFWYFWGDVRERIYLDNWKLVGGISYPTNLVFERNDIPWRSTQVLEVELDPAPDEKAFAMDASVAAKSSASPGWNRSFPGGKATPLAPGIDLFLGAWNSTIVEQGDGVVVLEAPISGSYVQGLLAEAARRHPGKAVKAVLSTSDSWPHVGGIRLVVAKGLPLYVLDLNRPLLDRLVAAPHTIAPDPLERAAPRLAPAYRVVAGKEIVGTGPNRMELYPLRGASTERQYMVYFPEHHILYASDTLAMNDDGSLYDPELMHEVVQAVEAAHLKVDTVFSMHQEPMPWDRVTALVRSGGAPPPKA
jgi:hypothetical protein